MYISDSHKFIFIHIRKSAGGSIGNTLKPTSIVIKKDLKSKIKGRILKLETNYKKYPFRQHCSILEVKNVVPKGIYDDYFKFAFVRNPYTRLVSEYEYIKRRPDHGRHKKVIKMDFQQYILYQSKRVDAHQINMLTNKKGELEMNFIGKFENLQEDWNYVCDKLNLASTSLIHQKKASKVSYSDYYNEENKDLVTRLWQNDLETFDYNYEDL